MIFELFVFHVAKAIEYACAGHHSTIFCLVFLSVSSHLAVEQDEIDVERAIVHDGVDCCTIALVNVGLRFGIPREKCVFWTLASKHHLFCC